MPRYPSRRSLAASAAFALLWGSASAQLTEPFPRAFDLATLNGVEGFIIDPLEGTFFNGNNVASAGDVNGDGIDDITSNAGVGACVVIFGSQTVAGSGTVDPGDLDGSNGFVIEDGVTGFRAGDLNNDGIDDLGVGFGNVVYVIFGAADLGASGTIDTASLSAPDGFAINSLPDDETVSAIARAGDLNHDGIDDFVVGVSNADPSGIRDAGEAYVIFGSAGVGSTGTLDLNALDGTNGFAVPGLAASARLGSSASFAGDINADGIDDLIIGARQAETAYVIFGRDTSMQGNFAPTIDLASLNGSDGFTISDSLDRTRFLGLSVAGAGDFNNDGLSDMVVRGDVTGFIILGTNGIGGSGAFDLAALNGPNGFVVEGLVSADPNLAGSVASLGDVNGDDVDDLIFGDPRGDSSAALAGLSYVVFGRDTPTAGDFAPQIETSDLDGSSGFRIEGFSQFGGVGLSVSAAGDVNADGTNDILIGTEGANESYVVFGRQTFAPSILEQPTGVLLPSAGGQAMLSVRVSGASSPTYQWRRDGVPLTDSGNITGANAPDLTVNASAADVGVYDCVVSSGDNSTTTQEVVLALRPAGGPGCTTADLTAPFGELDFFDVLAYLDIFAQGCP